MLRNQRKGVLRHVYMGKIDKIIKELEREIKRCPICGAIHRGQSKKKKRCGDLLKKHINSLFDNNGWKK